MRRLRVVCAAAIIATGLAVSGCATSGLDAQTSQEWQSRVLAIAESAETGDTATALLDLDALETEATKARTDGEISAERAAIIQQSITVVRADLEASVPEPVTPVPEPSVVTDEPSTDTDSDSGDKGNSDNKSDKGKKNDDKGNGNNGKEDDD